MIMMICFSLTAFELYGYNLHKIGGTQWICTGGMRFVAPGNGVNGKLGGGFGCTHTCFKCASKPKPLFEEVVFTYTAIISGREADFRYTAINKHDAASTRKDDTRQYNDCKNRNHTTYI